MYGRLMLTKLWYIDGKCYHDHDIHTDPMGYWPLQSIQSHSLHLTLTELNPRTGGGGTVSRKNAFWNRGGKPWFSGWWFGCHFLFSHLLGMSSSQLTNSYFSEGWPNHQPVFCFPSIAMILWYSHYKSDFRITWIPIHPIPKIPWFLLVKCFYHWQRLVASLLWSFVDSFISHDGSVCMPWSWFAIYHQQKPQFCVRINLPLTYGNP